MGLATVHPQVECGLDAFLIQEGDDLLRPVPTPVELNGPMGVYLS
jgi:hypothetical protein